MRFCADVLTGVPSIVVGIFVYTLVVLPMKQLLRLAGGIALGVIMLPIVARTTEEMLSSCPTRCARRRSRSASRRGGRRSAVVLRTARGGIVTGIMLAVARVAGETAPLLFTAFGNRFWQHGLDEPIASLPVQIYTYAISPYDDWHRQAWAGALVLMTLDLLVDQPARVRAADTRGDAFRDARGERRDRMANKLEVAPTSTRGSATTPGAARTSACAHPGAAP